MSHLSKIKTQFKNLDTLKSTLETMKCECVVGENLSLSSAYQKGQAVDMLVRPENVKYSYRFGNEDRKNDFMGYKLTGDGTYELLGDAYGQNVAGGSSFNFDSFGKEVTQKYARNEVVNQFNLNPELADFNLTEESVNDKGETVIKFERWG